MYDIVKQSIDYRAKCNNPRQDLMEFLIDLSKTGAFGESEKEKIEMIASQVVLFYLAGVDTISSAIANCIFELARNPEMRQKLQNEIDDTMTAYNNKVSYESLKNMTYLDLCLKGSIIFIVIHTNKSYRNCIMLSFQQKQFENILRCRF